MDVDAGNGLRKTKAIHSTMSEKSSRGVAIYFESSSTLR